MVRRIALDRGVGRWLAPHCAVAAFALQPMIVAYGASGMSEAAETFAVLWCVRHLMRWSEGRDPRDLAWAGLALAAGYLARYEVVTAAVGAGRVRRGGHDAGQPALTAGKGTGRDGDRDVPDRGGRRGVGTERLGGESGTVCSHHKSVRQHDAGRRCDTEGISGRGGPSEWLPVAARLFGMQPFVGMAAAGAVVYAVLARRPAALVPVVILGPHLFQGLLTKTESEFLSHACFHRSWECCIFSLVNLQGFLALQNMVGAVLKQSDRDYWRDQ